jgi:2-isopropylmalate synthase
MTTPVRSKATPPSQNYVRIFDTTLRDGEQAPGATLTSEEKLEVARALSRLGVDVIEAGFPSASPDDFQAVHDIAETIGGESVAGRPSSEPPIICGLARATEKDIQTAFDAIKIAKFPRIHIFLATSPLHREHKLRMTKEQVMVRAREMVTFAKKLCDDIEFSPEDAGRTEPEFLHEVLTAVIECGATTLNIPDTVGYTVPAEFGAIIEGIMKNVKGVENVVVSVHCHDDLGLATANALAGISAGARQAEVTINGIGERAGNTSLEEVVMALQTRQPMYGLKTGIDATQLVRTSRLVSVRTGMVVPPNKAIVGANAFAHESGIHQDGMLKHAGTYEIMRPETVGASKTLLVMGKHSGRHAFGVRLKELGHVLEGEALEAAFQRFKILADKKKRITDADLEALAASEVARGIEYYALDAVQVTCGSNGMPTATVRLRCPDGELRTQAAVGTGPVHAVFTAVDEIVKAPSELVEYTINAVTEGIDALGHASVHVRAVGSSDGRLNAQHGTSGAAILHGQAADSDVIVASTKAYIGALNRLLVTLGTYDKQAEKSQVNEKSQVREQSTGAAE